MIAVREYREYREYRVPLLGVKREATLTVKGSLFAHHDCVNWCASPRLRDIYMLT